MKKLKYPIKIYLQIEDEHGDIVPPEELCDNECVTWCDKRVNKSDIVYYRKVRGKK